MTSTDPTAERAQRVFEQWLSAFTPAVADGDLHMVGELVEPDGYLKDMLALTGGFRTFQGSTEIGLALVDAFPGVGLSNIRPSSDRIQPRCVRRSARDVVEGFFDFDTRVGRGTAFVRLVDAEPGPAKAWTILTALQELNGYEERIGPHRPEGLEYSQTFSGPNWLDRRNLDREYLDRDPEVLVIGGGQSGLILAARLVAQGVDVLVVEKTPRVGDNWRERYHSLTLHNEVWANSLPYMPFPPTWPTFMPKDKLAGWLEYYAEAMELNVWTSAEAASAEYDAEARTWRVEVRRAGHEPRSLTVPHVVLATGGASSIPHIPEIEGLSRFQGEVIHSSRYSSGSAYAGRRAIVVGTGNSGHDVAQDLHAHGVPVAMVQRSPTCVVSLKPSGTMVYAVYSEHPDIESIDLITASIPYPVLQTSYQWLTRKTCELDSELIDGLERVGFRTDYGPDGTGFHMKYLRQGGGYYINVGCSDLISAGEIPLVQAADIASFAEDGLRLADGTSLDADLVVLATGYLNQQEGVRRLMGDSVADLVGPIWGFDENHIMRNMWQRTAQPGLWIMGGSLVDGRVYSTFLALQIVAALRDVELGPGRDTAPSDSELSAAGTP
ncbi:flavin-containing monooxygenase [Nocardioides humi]|uniref:NAD(P)/FAD-dependent oxidoreductase n=1 Tax=Nocardioides humi TaxID=449461 RepID=A0ABN2AEK0_9ACTN|nr:NAD(P)/FAD-dependent oxidoreductase [Nocardioides humi]